MAPLEDDAAHWPLLSRLLDEALDLPPGERPRWLEGLAPEHRALEPRLRELLARVPAGGAPSPLDALPGLDPSGGPPADEAAPAGARAGDLVGPFRLVRPVGEGGMGRVWLAERADGLVQRPVALKLPRGEWQRTALAERMAREREILASLTHPHIASLHDAGVTAAGQPWLALEYVEGRSLDVHVREARPDVRARLALFLQMAQAVGHAHAHLVVHRDLKPGNVMVTAEGQVKLLDFGVAKLLEQGRAEETALTRLAGRALTPGYASPEQLRGAPVGVASDVYSLGVVLFELLAGVRPYRLARDSPAALEEAILQVEPARPSEVAADAAARRALRGDLDTVVLKALKKDPAERYQTVDAFAEDVERWLAGRPVRAQPDSRAYRLRKFVGRNRLGVGAATAVVVAVLAGAGASAWQARVARSEQRRAEEVKDFVAAVFRNADPYQGERVALRAVDLLKQAREDLDRVSEARADVRAELLNLVGSGLVALGDIAAAEPVIRQAVAESSSRLGEDHPQAMEARLLLVELLRYRGETEQVRAGLDRLLPLLRQQGRDRPESLVRGIEAQAHLALDEGRYQEAAATAQEALDLALARLGERHPATVASAFTLADAYVAGAGTYAEALAPAERAYRLAQAAHPGHPRHPSVIHARTLYARALGVTGDYRRALEELAPAVKDAREVFGPTSPLVADSLGSLSGMQRRAGDVRGAVETCDEAIRMQAGHLDTGSYEYAIQLVNRGTNLLAARRGAEALQDLSPAEGILERRLGSDHEETQTARFNRAVALAYLGRLAEARAALALVHQRSPKVTSPLWALHVAGVVERLGGDHRAALRFQEESFALIQEGPRADWDRLRILTEEGLDLLELGRGPEAEAALQQAATLGERLEQRVSPLRAEALVGLGRARLERSAAGEALPPLQAADRSWRELDPENRWAGEAALWLGRCQLALGHPAEGRRTVTRAEQILARSPLPSDARRVARVGSR